MVATPGREPATSRPFVAASARTLRFVLHPSGGVGEPTASLFRGELARAGYWLVEDDSAADAELRIATASEADGDLGKVSLELVQDGKVLHWLVTPIASVAPSAEDVGALVARLTTSVALAELAAVGTRHDRQLRPASAPASTEGPGAAGHVSKLAARRCRNEATTAACEDLARYVADHPDGPFAPAARAILERVAHRRAGVATSAPAP